MVLFGVILMSMASARHQALRWCDGLFCPAVGLSAAAYHQYAIVEQEDASLSSKSVLFAKPLIVKEIIGSELAAGSDCFTFLPIPIHLTFFGCM